MNIKYEVHSNYGAGTFETIKDAVTALQMFGNYENLELNRKEITYYLEKNGYYEKFPLAIIKTES